MSIKLFTKYYTEEKLKYEKRKKKKKNECLGHRGEAAPVNNLVAVICAHIRRLAHT